MKKLLVAVAAATLTLAGIAAPAHATGITYPSITGNSGSNVAIGSSITGVAGSNYGVGMTVVVDGFIFCSAPQAVVQGTHISNYMNFSMTAPQCGWIDTNMARASNPWVVASDFYDDFSSLHMLATTGYDVRYAEIVTDGVNYYTYYSSAYTIAAAAQTVTYNANGAAGSVAAQTSNGARAVSNGAGFSQNGYTFAGWNTAANGSGTAIAAGASYTPSGNVTLYAQWNRIPTPPAPAFTSPIAVAPVGGIVNLTGSNLAAVTSILVDDMPATITSTTSGAVSVKLPTLAPGKYDITIKNADGAIKFIDGLVVPDPNAKVAPKPTTTYVASSAVVAASTKITAAQAAQLTAFAAQYKNAKQITVYIKTSKAGLAAAKKAAASMLAAAAKAIKGAKTGIVVDSTNETKTSLDLVVND